MGGEKGIGDKMNYSILHNNFSAGEISPMLEAREDSQALNNGAREIMNFLPIETGGIKKRPGTKYLGPTYHGDNENYAGERLIEYPQPDGTLFVLEIGDIYTRVWDKDGPLNVILGTPWDAQEIPDIKYSQAQSTLILVHKNHSPRIIDIDPATGKPVLIGIPVFTGNSPFSIQDGKNYPSVVTFAGGRLWLGGTIKDPCGLWGSRAPDAANAVNRYYDYTLKDESGEVFPDHAIYIQENDMYGSSLLWIANNRLFIAATTSTLKTLILLMAGS
jgi:hypothetical protein